MKYIYVCIAFALSLKSSIAAELLWEDELREAIIPNSANGVLTAGTAEESGTSFVDAVLLFARDTIFALMAVIAIWMFLFIGARLVIARWNPEEFKKAMLSFVYAAIGIFIVAAAWVMVRLIAGLDI